MFLIFQEQLRILKLEAVNVFNFSGAINVFNFSGAIKDFNFSGAINVFKIRSG